MKKRQFIIQVLLIGLVFALFAFFRFYNLDKRVGFDWDQEQFSTQIREIIVNHKLTLLGPRVVSDTGFFLGPYFTYFLIPFYLLTNLHPSALIYFLIFFNILFFTASFFIIKKLFRFQSAIFFLLLWSVNPLLIKYDAVPWWPLTIPLGVILTWFTLYKIYKSNTIKDWFILGAILGLFMNMHFQFIFIILFSGFFLLNLVFIEKKNKFDLKKILSFLLTFLVFFTPLLLFDLRHNFLNIGLFTKFFLSKETVLNHDPNVWFIVFTNFLQSFIFIKSELIAKIFYFVLLIIIIYLFKKRKKFYKLFYLTTLFLWLIFPLFFILYGKRPSEYYFIFLFPFILIIIIDFILMSKKKYVLYFLILIFFSLNIQKTLFNLNVNKFGLYYKDSVVKKIKERVINKKFNISFDVPLGRNTGFRYLLDHYKIKQTGNWDDPLVEIRIPPKENDIKVEEIGIKIPKELR